MFETEGKEYERKIRVMKYNRQQEGITEGEKENAEGTERKGRRKSEEKGNVGRKEKDKDGS